jgi:peptidyl-tRNA hydrolase, PTH2 family
MVKQVIVVRKDLNMRKGKMIAQASHAVLKVFLDRLVQQDDNNYSLPLTNEMKEWMEGFYTKICVGVNSEEELLEIYQKATEADLPVALITDMGLTEFHGVPTKTCLAIGSAKSEAIDGITGHLKLL